MPERDAPPFPNAPAGSSGPFAPSRPWRWAIYALVGVVLALVFVGYVQPDMMVTLATQLWACF